MKNFNRARHWLECRLVRLVEVGSGVRGSRTTGAGLCGLRKIDAGVFGLTKADTG